MCKLLTAARRPARPPEDEVPMSGRSAERSKESGDPVLRKVLGEDPMGGFVNAISNQLQVPLA